MSQGAATIKDLEKVFINNGISLNEIVVGGCNTCIAPTHYDGKSFTQTFSSTFNVPAYGSRTKSSGEDGAFRRGKWQIRYPNGGYRDLNPSTYVWEKFNLITKQIVK